MGRRIIFSLPFLISWALMGLFLIQMILTFILLWPVTSIEDVFLSISTNPNYLISRMFSVLLSLRFGWFDTFPEWLTFFYRLVTALTWIEISAIAVLPFLMASRLFGSRFPAELARAHLTWWSEIVIGVFMLSFVGVIIAFSLWPYPATVLLLIKVLLALLICGWLARLVYTTLYRPFRHEHPIEPPHIEG
jgi:ABC-type multidrug transport system fused ATPase/permease subunit